MDLQQLLDDICAGAASHYGQGRVADYIPALASVAPAQFGIAIHTLEGDLYSSGQAQKRFSIQSISKAFSLTMAIHRHGDELWQRVGKEPSGTAFNSLVQLEFEKGIPRNPFINAGALVVADSLCSRLSAPVHAMLETVRLMAGTASITIDRKVADSEYEHRYRNAAMANLMKSFGNFENEVDRVLRAYFSYCALSMNCVELARAFSFLAADGRCPQSGRQWLTKRQTQQLNALLLTSGLYDAAGDFAYRVGMPGKSGVGGGIMAVVPGRFTVCVWAPELNEYGNSVVGLWALEELSKALDLSLF
ncbi:glutaminase B [Gallaecimonas pentaromativorans]|uniref:Glutaminase n=1 Tax=Gallaecimonas pentaromativorans TaxID=584787 RepID=A0A3N1PAM0_9GAMM|nr:glutaminase B [Gallaecimonas pentaromativorans]ROQ28442.1 L-glutaminase [Gallaecimonas pentaromativorans]